MVPSCQGRHPVSTLPRLPARGYRANAPRRSLSENLIRLASETESRDVSAL
jgi:hypothetical protein